MKGGHGLVPAAFPSPCVKPRAFGLTPDAWGRCGYYFEPWLLEPPLLEPLPLEPPLLWLLWLLELLWLPPPQPPGAIRCSSLSSWRFRCFILYSLLLFGFVCCYFAAHPCCKFATHTCCKADECEV